MKEKQMEAALEMVLAFHRPGQWDSQREQEWTDLQVEAGREFPVGEATTRTLCDTIREVLGRQM